MKSPHMLAAKSGEEINPCCLATRNSQRTKDKGTLGVRFADIKVYRLYHLSADLPPHLYRWLKMSQNGMQSQWETMA